MMDQETLLISLALRAKEGDNQAFEQILGILDPEIKKRFGKYFIPGADEQDVLQECRIGVWKAVRDYSNDGGMTFKNFAIGLCCKRHLITAFAHANRKKFDLQNNACSLDAPVLTGEDDLQQTLADFVQDKTFDLLNDIIAKEEYQANMSEIESKLTPLEKDIFYQYAQNDSYKEIAENLDCKPKTVDNALMRIRKKANEVYKKYSDEENLMFSSTTIKTSTVANTSFGSTFIAATYNFIGITSSSRPRLSF